MDKNAKFIIEMLNNHGFEAYAVGGAVRDMIMDRMSDDWDITTSALPHETKTVFSDYPVLETGVKHGTVGVVIDRTVYEVTTYRTEQGYADSRHPDSVTFVRDIESDLARRDFTVNAIAYSDENGFVDLYGGMEDIKSKRIKTVGNPFERFSEDALRILRALRFASVLGFEIEENTANAAFQLAHTLKKVSPERIYVELKKLLLGINAQNVIDKYKDVLSAVIKINGNPELVSQMPDEIAMRLTCLCGEYVTEALGFLKADNYVKHICSLLINSSRIPEDRTEIKKYISKLGRVDALSVVTYRRSRYGEDKNGVAEQILMSNECLFVQDLEIKGNDLLELGFKGKSIGLLLDKLLLSVIEGKIENKKESLLAAVKNIDNRQ